MDNAHQRELAEAMEIAIDAGVLQRCEFHSHCVYAGNAEIVDAYKLGNFRFSNGELSGAFASRTAMTECIKEVVHDSGGATSCGACAHHYQKG